MADFTELKVWQAAHTLALEAYRFTGRFPRAEQFGLTSQIRHSGATSRRHKLEWHRTDAFVTVTLS